MAEQFATLEVQRYRPRQATSHSGLPVTETLYLRLRESSRNGRRTLATLPTVPLVRRSAGKSPEPVPADRARTWEELAKWVQYAVISTDPAVQLGQYENRLKWQNWAHLGRERPGAEDLYDWRRDSETLERLRPTYERARIKLERVIGRPSRADAAARYPNPFEDEGLSDDARRSIRDLKAVFGSDVLQD